MYVRKKMIVWYKSNPIPPPAACDQSIQFIYVVFNRLQLTESLLFINKHSVIKSIEINYGQTVSLESSVPANKFI